MRVELGVRPVEFIGTGEPMLLTALHCGERYGVTVRRCKGDRCTAELVYASDAPDSGLEAHELYGVRVITGGDSLIYIMDEVLQKVDARRLRGVTETYMEDDDEAD